jgi:hypothetical protein
MYNHPASTLLAIMRLKEDASPFNPIMASLKQAGESYEGRDGS